MRLTTRRSSQLVLVGFAAALFSVAGLAAPVAADTTPDPRVETATISRPSETLPGRDTPLPVAAAGLLVGSAGLAWLVRRSAPSAA